QIGRIIGRLPHFVRRTTRMAEAELCKVERANKALDCPHRILRSDIVLNPGRKKTGLLPAIASLERPIRHEPYRTSSPENARVLAQPRHVKRNIFARRAGRPKSR